MTPTETSTGAEHKIPEEKVAQVGDTVRRITAAKAEKQRGKASDEPEDQALDTYDKLVKFKKGKKLTFPKADPENHNDHDLMLPLDSDKPWRVAQISDVEVVDGSQNFVCLVESSDGETKSVSVPRTMVLDAQLVSQREEFQKVFKDATESKMFTAYMDALPQSGGKELTIDDLPQEAQMKALEQKYSSASYEPEVDDEEVGEPESNAEKDPSTRAQEAIIQKIKELESKGKSLSDTERTLLRDLRISQVIQRGSLGAAFTANLMDRMSMPDLVDTLNQNGEVMQAEVALSKILKDAVGEKQFEQWVKESQGERGIFGLLENKDFINLLTKDNKFGGEVCQAIFGQELTGKQITELFKAANLVNDLPKEMQDAIAKGQVDGAGFLKWLLLIIGPIFLAAAGAVEMTKVATGPSQ